MRHNRRRWVRRALMCFALGLATTYLVAWILAFRLNVTSAGPFSTGPLTMGARARDASHGEGSGTFLVMRVVMFGSTSWTCLVDNEPYRLATQNDGLFKLPFTESTVEDVARGMEAWLIPRVWPGPGTGSSSCTWARSVWARGWPMRAVCCCADEPPQPSDNDPVICGGIGLNGSSLRWLPRWARRCLFGYDAPVLPWQPMWLGLVADTLLFSVLWACVLFTPSPVRRHLRFRRNHCPHCNYDLRATPRGSPCPECGRPYD